MKYVFEIVDKTGRKIHLTEEQWKHIRKDHPEIREDEIKLTLRNPIRIRNQGKNKHFYYQYLKYKKLPFRFLRVIVKYLNGKGFVITTYFVKNIT